MQTSYLNVNNTESDHATAIFRQFQDAIFSREITSVKTLTKVIFDLLQWQEIATLSLPKKAAIASFILACAAGGIRELKIETFSGRRQLQPDVTSSFVG